MNAIRLYYYTHVAFHEDVFKNRLLAPLSVCTRLSFTEHSHRTGQGKRNGPYASLAAMFLNRVSHFDCVINRGC